MRTWLKSFAERLPPSLGRPLARVPHAWRLGRGYSRTRARLARFAGLAREDQAVDLLDRLRREVAYAYERVPFYRSLYDRAGFHPSMLRTIEDLQAVPIVTKQDLQRCALDERSARVGGRMLINTGGSSGQPLHFYVDSDAFAREWAHMHEIWARLGYRPSCCKLTFRGKNLGDRPVRYNAVHNEFAVNAYAPRDRTMPAVQDVCRRYRIEFLHGYPSSIALFARCCRDEFPEIATTLRASLKGILFGSEFPAPQYRELAESVFGAPSISWYGHSEMAILAWEVDRYVYEPFPTYGYCEAVRDEEGAYHLVGTSFGNTASPFIRYDTEDCIAPEFDGGLLRRFRVERGRVGDVITDARGTPVSLTALVFGRHHRAFEWASFVQVRQDRPGEAAIMVTGPSGKVMTEESLAGEFDFEGVAMRFRFELRTEPVRTPAGKLPLLVGGSGSNRD
jgi:phenylacetate-CoA ligase